MTIIVDSEPETWEWAKNDFNKQLNLSNQNMVISNWEWNIHNTKYRAIFDSSGKVVGELGSNFEHSSPIVPVLAVIMLTITVFLLILFRQNPGLVAGTVAGCLTIIGIYLTLNTIKENTLTFE